MTSNYASHSGAGSKSTTKTHPHQTTNFTNASMHLNSAEMYHLSAQQHQQVSGGIGVTGASKSKLGAGQNKPTIAISGSTKRKNASHSNLVEQSASTLQGTKGSKASRTS